MNRNVLNGVHEAIGGTPIVKLSRLTGSLAGTILAKLEYLNPGFSKKDRAALQIISEAEQAGILRPGQTVIELTSGNMGTGLAIVCAVKGYPFIAVMSKGNSMERARMMRALGAEVVLVDQAPNSCPGQVSGEDLALVEQATEKLTSERGAFRADQFRNPGNVHAHAYNTAEEIWEQTAGQIDAFVDFAGSGGTFVGIAGALKKRNPKIRCYLVSRSVPPIWRESRWSTLPTKYRGEAIAWSCHSWTKPWSTDFWGSRTRKPSARPGFWRKRKASLPVSPLAPTSRRP
ncbi:MAG TPA: cysteine synthase family protein [Selenomonadales bacterium]|nr:cysteine synthase family protein [Selenomonadales bacterium]